MTSNGTRTMVLEFFPSKTSDIPMLTQFGNVSFDHEKILEGRVLIVVSNDVCVSNPCNHNGMCHVTWNDFWCQCPRCYTSKTCQEIEFCQLQDCLAGSRCQNFDDCYECIANAIFDIIEITYRSNTDGTLLHVASHVGDQHFTVSVFKDNVTVSWQLDLENQGTVSFGKVQPEGQPRSSAHFNYQLWHDLLVTGIVTLGGLSSALSDKHTYVTVGLKHDRRDGIEGNSVDYGEHRLTTAIPSHSMMSGEPFKGCLGKVRIGSILLHYFTNEEVYQNANFTLLEFLTLQSNGNATHLDSIGCMLCFYTDCKKR
ncbi:protein crumbs-like isoform X1 [Linepithema humile]|uniref:protein crumbs-like isoform X1 n=1 Tax=Linepithema humile TaxID=83485 RepID=UPI00351F1041